MDTFSPPQIAGVATAGLILIVNSAGICGRQTEIKKNPEALKTD
jgi:hypothetical protein